MNNTRFSWDSVSKITEPHTSEPLKINLLLQYPDSEECKMNVAQILLKFETLGLSMILRIFLTL